MFFKAQEINQFYFVSAWNDCRTSSILETIFTKTYNKINYLKSVCGLPFSNCFSALKCRWLIDNIPSIQESIRNRECLFGTLDTWIIWNLTGGKDNGTHVTDATNASHTMLMNITTLEWDEQLCNFFKIPSFILPSIQSCAEIYGYVLDGPLKGVPIAAVSTFRLSSLVFEFENEIFIIFQCISEQSASLLAQCCVNAQQMTCTFDDGCSLMVNTGEEIIDSNNGLLTTIAFQLGTGKKPSYALEGAVAYAGSAVRWLKENLALNDEAAQNTTSSPVQSNGNGGTMHVQTFIGDSAVLSSYSSGSNFGALCNFEPPQTDVVFVPAFSGLHSPFWKHNSSGLMLGLNHRTSAYQVILAGYEAICFQARDLIEALVSDTPTWPLIERLSVCGEFSENPFLLQLLADLCGVKIERPQANFPACLGAMIATGIAMKLFTLDETSNSFAPPIEIFKPRLCSSS